MVTDEQQHWNDWNVQRARAGLVNERVALFAAATREVLALPLPQGSRMLDIGCGAGWLAAGVAQRFDYFGIDLANEGVAEARRLIPGARFEAADFLAFQSPGGYDLISCIDTVAYFRDQDAALEKMAHLLTPGGWLVLTTVNPYVYARMSRIGPPGKGQVRQWLTKPQLHALIERHDFTVRRSYTVAPDGDTGPLRWTQAPKLNRPLNAVLGERRVSAFKEWLGLGQFRVVVAQRSR